MNFSVDKINKKIKIEREFSAQISKVWAAWTESELLDQWWAPKPWKAKTKSLDFKEGGYWLYAMVGPDGTTHWARADFNEIKQFKSFSAQDAFCDENGNINESFPRSQWLNDFKELPNSTMVVTEITFNELANLEQMVEMGFREGFISALGNLDDLLK